MRIGIEVIIGAGLITANDGVVEIERSCNVIRIVRLAHGVIKGFILANGGLVGFTHRVFKVGALRCFIDRFVLKSGVGAFVLVAVVRLSSSH